METVIITVLVFIILSVSYAIFGINMNKKEKIEYEKNQMLCNFFQQEIKKIKSLQLEGVGDDGNSDFEFIRAVKKIKMPVNVRIQIYEKD